MLLSDACRGFWGVLIGEVIGKRGGEGKLVLLIKSCKALEAPAYPDTNGFETRKGTPSWTRDPFVHDELDGVIEEFF